VSQDHKLIETGASILLVRKRIIKSQPDSIGRQVAVTTDKVQ
jgi:hypothetical protein